jgi:hypothetical protein
MDNWLVIYCCAAQRLVGVTNATYRGQLIQAIETRLRIHRMPINLNINGIFGLYKDWKDDKNYITLMALIDMFLFKFPKSRFADVRVCTIVTRFRDCAGLMELAYLSDLVDMEFPEIAKWIWNERLANDFERINMPDNEADNQYSYTPYMMDLGLSEKSPYSGKTNPNFHLWVHVIGTTMGMTRSKHARMAGNPNAISMITMGKVFAYAHTVRGDFKIQFAEGGIDPILAAEAEAKEIEAELGEDNQEVPVVPVDTQSAELPRGLDGINWYAWFKDLKFEFPEELNAKVEKAWSKLSDIRPGTVGDFLKRISDGGAK